MKITVLAFGTRGDVQPTIALGKALKERGHSIRIIASANFASWIERHGLEGVSASIDIQALMMGEGGQEWVEHGNNTVKQMQVMKKLLDQYGLEMMQDAWAACRDAEVVVSSFTSDIYAVSIAEKLGAKHISIPVQPAMVATRSGMSTPFAPIPTRESTLNYLFGKLIIEPYPWRLLGAMTNRFRQEILGLSPQTYKLNRRGLQRMLVVQGFSPHVVPPAADLPPNIHTAGYWFLDEDQDWQLPKALVDFLDAGDPPVYIGFGSMAGRDPVGLTDIIVRAVAQSGQRAILQSGWAGLGETNLPPNIYLIDAAPHNWLFPRVSMVVHHGGAGTTAESIRAGVPMIVVPHMADQPFWGARAAALGVGPRPIPRNKLSAGKLAAAILQAKSDTSMRNRATELGSRVRGEDGTGKAVELMEAYLGS